jgi:hypothetical protein
MKQIWILFSLLIFTQFFLTFLLSSLIDFSLYLRCVSNELGFNNWCDKLRLSEKTHLKKKQTHKWAFILINLQDKSEKKSSYVRKLSKKKWLLNQSWI